MFALLGTAEVFFLLLIGAFMVPMFITPTHRGGPLLFPIEFTVRDEGWPAVSIVAEHGGLIAWLLMLINRAPMTCLQVDATTLAYHIGGVLPGPTTSIRLANVTSAKEDPRRPRYWIPAMVPVGIPMLIFGKVGRLTLMQFGAGLSIVALFGVLSQVQSTNNLVITVEGRKKPIVFPFTTIGWEKRPAVTREEVRRAGDRIMKLAIAAKAREGQ
jgi:hypothetical protein